MPIESQIRGLVEAIAVFHSSRAQEVGSLSFDKDDINAVEFVTAAANIRANNFSIPMESFFKIKEMAGKIVPAISSSNALAGSL